MAESTKSKHIGRIVGIWRYPVKSMGHEELQEVDVSWFGLAGDRRWAFVRDDAISSGFPWLTIRERSDMNHYQPSFVDPSKPDKSQTVVRTPTGEVLSIMDKKLTTELYPNGAHVIKQNRGAFDTFPLSLITTQTINKLSENVGTKLSVQRFRPNLLIKTNDNTPFLEDNWIGNVLRIGNLRMRVDKRDSRCVVITIDPVTSERKPEILRAVVNQREGCLGVYGTTVEPGKVIVGDDVVIEYE